jgi:hypothetical protein
MSASHKAKARCAQTGRVASRLSGALPECRNGGNWGDSRRAVSTALADICPITLDGYKFGMAIQDLFPIAPAPWLWLQIAISFGWLALIGRVLLQSDKKLRFLWILTVPVVPLSWWIIVFVVYLRGCAAISGSGC